MNKNFYVQLLNRINYRNKILYGDNNKLEYAKELKKHFYIIIGKTKTEDKIKKTITALNDKTSNVYKNVMKNITDKYKKEMTVIKDIYENCSNEIDDIQLFVDDNIWYVNDLFNPNYKVKTQWLKE